MKEKKESTTSNKIADALRKEVNYGRLHPGDKLIEREIAQKYEASHIPVREALRILEGEGFIVHQKFAGYTVREVTPEEMIELYNIMRFLSVQLLTRAIPRYTEITFYQLRTLLTDMAKAKEPDAIISMLIRFAEIVYYPAGLNYTYGLAKQILNRNIPVLQGLIKNVGKGAIPTDKFETFIDLCQKNDVEKTVKYVIDQYDKVTKLFVAYMSESKKG